VLEAVFILLEFPSPSRRIFIGSHSLPPSLVRRIGPSTNPMNESSIPPQAPHVPPVRTDNDVSSTLQLLNLEMSSRLLPRLGGY
jgi:hypothetical protein